MRAGEQFSLRWKNMDLDQRLITLADIRNSNSRVVHLNNVAFSAMLQIPKQSNRSPYVFFNRYGEQLRRARDWFEPAVEEAKVEDCTWHCLRHTFCSRLVMIEADLRTWSRSTS